MSVSDPIADMLTRIRNAIRNRQKHVMVPRSKVCSGIARVLKEEGYINDFDEIEDNKQGVVRLELKYGPRGERLIRTLRRESRPSCRVYRRVEDLPRPMAGLGITVVSTSHGILSDRQCREQRVGGELLCSVQ